MSMRLQIGLLTLAVICLAMVFRVAYISNTKVYKPIRGDAYYYFIYAHNLVKYRVFSKQLSEHPVPDSYWAPGYPTFLAGILKIAGEKNFYPATLYLQALLGALTAGLVVLFGSRFLPLWAAVLAGMLTALSPHLISLGGYVLTETLFCFLLMLFLLAYAVAIKVRSVSASGVAGLLAGASYLVNPVIFFAPFALAVVFFFLHRKKQPLARSEAKKVIGMFLSVFLLVVTLWSVRSHINVPPTSASSADRALANFVIGSHDDFFEIYRANPRDPNNPAQLDQEKINGSWMSFLHLLGQRVRNNPSHYGKWYLVEKPILLWSWSIMIGQGDIYVYPVFTSLFTTSKLAFATYSAMKACHRWLLLLGVISGILLYRCRNDPAFETILALYVLIVYVSAVYVILQAEPRYSVPLRPEMYLCAVFGFTQITALLKHVFEGRLTMEERADP